MTEMLVKIFRNIDRNEKFFIQIFAIISTIVAIIVTVLSEIRVVQTSDPNTQALPPDPLEFVDVVGPFYFIVLISVCLLAIFSAARVGGLSKFDELAIRKFELGEEGNQTISNIFSRSRERLMSESARIQQISIMNLLIGLFFCIMGLGILGHSVVLGEKFSFENYLPRAAIGILVQLVGFFFLRLFHTGEADIRFNKNEITNIEMKLASIVMVENADHKAAIIASLANDDRNFAVSGKQRVVSEKDVQLDDFVTKVRELASVFDSKGGKDGG